MVNEAPNIINPENIVDQLYDIALDPNSLDSFIEAWNAAGLDTKAARKTIKTIDDFDSAYLGHLIRAETFLARGAETQTEQDLAAMLAPFEDLAAFIVDRQLAVVASNAGARHAFGFADDTKLSDMHLSPEMKDSLETALKTVFNDAEHPDCLLRLQSIGVEEIALCQIRGLAESAKALPLHALVVTTQYHWQTALGQTLEDVFKLTAAELGVLKAMVKGMDAKAISTVRSTSEGTVRGQIKSILSKMNARSQSEVIRLVLSLRDVSQGASGAQTMQEPPAQSKGQNWPDKEVWKAFKTLILPDGRKMDYHDMGPADGAPILFTHMGYGMARWHGPMIELAFQLGLRVIVPIRAGYGHSDNMDPKADVLENTRNDTCALLDHLDIKRLPYVCQGNDLIFGMDFAGHFPERVSEIAGICARLPQSSDWHYSAMGKWHRFFLSTAKHAPHLLHFTAKAGVAMAKRLGPIDFFRQINQNSTSDQALLQDPELLKVMMANGELVVGKTTNVSQAYAMELLQTEADWTDIALAAQSTPTWFVNGGEDPASDIATIAESRETFPWINIEMIANGGQMLIFQHFKTIIPMLAAAARRLS